MGFSTHTRMNMGTRYDANFNLNGVKTEEASDRLPSKCEINPTVAPLSSFHVATAFMNFATMRVKMMGKMVGFYKRQLVSVNNLC